ncbi:MAG: hypothetical protein TREMPRED_005188, partial [Tremellales sp. Tagirdzhanova-0007]
TASQHTASTVPSPDRRIIYLHRVQDRSFGIRDFRRQATVPAMISDTTLTNLSNGLGVAAMACIVLYHFIAVNGKRMQE